MRLCVLFHSLTYVWWLGSGPVLGFHSCQLSFTLILLLSWNSQDKSIRAELYWAVSVRAIIRIVLGSKTHFSFIIEWSSSTRLFCGANSGSLQWTIQQSPVLPLITQRETTGTLEDQNLLRIVSVDKAEMSAAFQTTSAAQGRLGREESELRLWELAWCSPSRDETGHLGSVPRESRQELPSSLICRLKDMSNALDVTPHLSHCRLVVLLQQSHNHPLESGVAAGMLSHSRFASRTNLRA